jgi:hypothetical protein
MDLSERVPYHDGWRRPQRSLEHEQSVQDEVEHRSGNRDPDKLQVVAGSIYLGVRIFFRLLVPYLT